MDTGQEWRGFQRFTYRTVAQSAIRSSGSSSWMKRRTASGWSEEDHALARAVAQELAVAFQDARSYQLTQQALVEMREADRLKKPVSCQHEP